MLELPKVTSTRRHCDLLGLRRYSLSEPRASITISGDQSIFTVQYQFKLLTYSCNHQKYHCTWLEQIIYFFYAGFRVAKKINGIYD